MAALIGILLSEKKVPRTSQSEMEGTKPRDGSPSLQGTFSRCIEPLFDTVWPHKVSDGSYFARRETADPPCSSERSTLKLTRTNRVGSKRRTAGVFLEEYARN